MTAATLTIDLEALIANWRLFQDRCEKAGAEAGAVLKADAYGLGAAEVGRALMAAGCRRFFVAHAGEGVCLSRALGDDPALEIIVFHGCRAGEAGLFAGHRLIPVLNSLRDVEAWANFASEADYRPAVLHFDTGMNRLGLDEAACQHLFERSDLLAAIDFKMIMTHLACSDEPSHPMNHAQRQRFEAMLAARPEALFGLPLSMSNSAGVLNGADYIYDVGRVGIGLYGGNPFADLANPCRLVVSLEAELLQVRTLPEGETVSYGAAWRAGAQSRVATIALGYADGLFRAGEGRAEVAINGKRAPIIGRVTMDLIMIDVSAFSEAEIVPGMMVEVMGPTISVDELAAAMGSISYEVLTSVGRLFESGRVQRVYKNAR